ncbi:Ig-like domain-containing protein [Paenarthrobacter sp. S56]|uniref:Ig-like domain-containing protein n=1 Tax=Paenarthrobacter sp. S56 TaxID=3138179 RepID=UPI00321B3B93
MGRWNRLVVLVLGVLLVSWGGPAASAFWSSVSSNGAAAKADALAQGSKPGTTVSGANVTVTWAASATTGGKSVSGYSIARYDSATGGTRVAATGSCAGTLNALNCVESNVPAGTWFYTVTPKLALWQGPESARSAGTTPITDTTPPDAPTVTVTGIVNSGNVGNVPVGGTAEANSTVTLTVSGTGAASFSQTITTSSSGSWTAVPVDVSRFADGTITFSAKATDAAGNTGLAGTATSSKDVAAPTVSSVVLGNGGTANKIDKGDTVTITFSEALKASTLCSAWTNNATTYTVNGGNQVTVNVTAGDVLTVTSSGCSLGSIALGADYTSSALSFSGPGSGNASSLVWNPTAKTLTITLGAGTAGDKTIPANPAVFPSYTPAGGITDPAGNALATTAVTGTSARF